MNRVTKVRSVQWKTNDAEIESYVYMCVCVYEFSIDEFLLLGSERLIFHVFSCEILNWVLLNAARKQRTFSHLVFSSSFSLLLLLTQSTRAMFRFWIRRMIKFLMKEIQFVLSKSLCRRQKAKEKMMIIMKNEIIITIINPTHLTKHKWGNAYTVRFGNENCEQHSKKSAKEKVSLTMLMMMEQKKTGSEVIRKHLFACTSHKFILIESRDAVYSSCPCPSRLTCWQQTPKKSLESFISNWKLRNIFFFALFSSVVCLLACLFVCSYGSFARARDISIDCLRWQTWV